jgi:hypothetical protein
MLKFTSVSGSVRAITDITLTGTVIRTHITIDLIIDRTTGRTTGTEDIVIIAIIIVTPIITGISLTGIAKPILSGNALRDPAVRSQAFLSS